MKRSPLKRSSKPMAQRSKKTVSNQKNRDATREAVAERAGGACEYQHIIPEVRCGWLPDRRVMEVDEIRGGAQRSTEQYDPSRCKYTCPTHHDFKTANKQEVRRRLGDL